jgi:hypothetical protein
MGDTIMTRLLTTTILCLALLVSVAGAKQVGTVTPIDPAALRSDVGAPVPQQVGNVNAPAFAISSWFTGQESYAAVFDPSAQLGCDNGFQVQMVHQIMQFTETQVPVTFDVYAGLGSAVWDPTVGCFVPGPLECRGATFTVTIDAAGLYDIAIPLDCDCAFMYDPTGAPYIYYVSMTYPTLFSANVVSDGVPANCFTYNDYGTGWVDLGPIFTTGGNVNVFGEAVCCDTPVATEGRTWGNIKSLFR